MSIPKRHHYLPQFYLRRFAEEDGYLWVFDRSQQHLRRERPKSIAVRKHYYSTEDQEGNKDATMEEFFSFLEGKSKRVFDKLDENSDINLEDRYYLATFMGFLACRIPAFERSLNEAITGFAEVLMRKNVDSPGFAQRFDKSPEELTEYINSGELSLAANGNMRLENILNQGPIVARALFSQRWRIVRAPSKTSFVTSDRPFGIVVPDEIPFPYRNRPWGILSPEVIAAFPLSCQTCLFMQGKQMVEAINERVASRDEVRNINLAVIKETETYAMARNKKHLESLARAGSLHLENPLHKVEMENLPHPSGNPMKSVLVSSREKISE